MIIVASSNANVGIQDAMEVLRAGGTAVDAVETAIRHVEANPDDHSVGFSGYPNLLGDVELDASIMDGHDLTVGAVGAMQSFPHAISVARKVMETLPHVFLVGSGAERFAKEMGFKRQELLTEEAARVWRERLEADMGQERIARLSEQPDLWRWVEITTDPERAHGTVNVIAQDGKGHIAAGASTSGWAWKYPGRIGDSPIIGAGVYADDRYGAAACTGTGEMAIRAATARSLILYMKLGFSLQEACLETMQDLDDLGGRFLSRMSYIAIDNTGRHAGYSNGKEATYIVMTDDMETEVSLPRTYIATTERWGQTDPQQSTP